MGTSPRFSTIPVGVHSIGWISRAVANIKDTVVWMVVQEQFSSVDLNLVSKVSERIPPPSPPVFSARENTQMIVDVQ